MSRKFAKIKPSIWRNQLSGFSPIGKLLAIYLMTNEHFQMVGIYRIHKFLISEDLGLELNQIDVYLSELIDSEFCAYDEKTKFIWVKHMAVSQVADNPNEKQSKGVIAELTRLYVDEECLYVGEFLLRYGKKFEFLPKDVESLEYSSLRDM